MQSQTEKQSLSEQDVEQVEEVDQDLEPARKKSPERRNAASLTPSSDSEQDD